MNDRICEDTEDVRCKHAIIQVYHGMPIWVYVGNKNGHSLTEI